MTWHLLLNVWVISHVLQFSLESNIKMGEERTGERMAINTNFSIVKSALNGIPNKDVASKLISNFGNNTAERYSGVAGTENEINYNVQWFYICVLIPILVTIMVLQMWEQFRELRKHPLDAADKSKGASANKSDIKNKRASV